MNAVTNSLTACAVNTMLIEWDNELISMLPSFFLSYGGNVRQRHDESAIEICNKTIFDFASVDDGWTVEKRETNK